MSTSERKRGRLLLLRNEALRRLWATEIWSSAGEALGLIALPLLVYDRTDSARMVGLVSLLLILPRVFLSPVAGFLADHADRRQIMIAAFVERAVVAAIVPFTGATWQIGGLAIAMAVGNSFSRPAELSAIPSIAPPESLVQALSLIQVTNGIIRIAAPAAGAALIAASGPEPIFWIQALAYLASMVVVRKLVIPEDRDIEHWQLRRVIGIAKTEMWAGLAAIRSVPIVRGVTATESLWQLAGSALVVAGVVYTKDTLRLGDHAEAAFALMTTSMSAGAVFGATVASILERRIGRARLMAIGYLGPAFLITAAISPPMPVIYGAWFCFGMADAWAVISFQAYLAETIPAAMRGRVYAAWGAVVALAGAISFEVVGLVTNPLGAPAVFLITGLIVGIGGPVLLLLTGALASIRHHPASRPITP